MKKAYIFPGQGSQFSGMGKELYQSSTVARDLFEAANEILGFRITDIMFNGSEDELKQTEVTQPAIFLHSYVLAKTLQDFNPQMVAGHSLGEYSALASADSLKFEDALRLVRIRAVEMQKCCDRAPGTMAAILGLETTTIEDICRQVEGVVIPANYNCDGQVVISGEKTAVNEACARLKEAGAKRALPLAVSGAFHSPLMQDAEVELAKAIQATKFSTPVCPVYQNVTAEAETDPERIKDNLLAQLTSPVKWTQSVKKMIEDGADSFTELGPGNVLQGLVRKIASSTGKEILIEGKSN